MKKILSMILLLCLAGTMNAQMKQGYVVLQTADGNLTIKDCDIERITFDIRPQNQLFQMIWYVIGADMGQGAWTFEVPLNSIPMYVEDAENEILSYTGYFAGQGFKLSCEGWEFQWGSYGYGNYSMNDYSADNIYVPTPGLYRIVFNTQNRTLSIEPYISSGSYRDISISGTFNNGEDMPLSLVQNLNGESHDWYANITFPEDGEVMFKANDGVLGLGGSDFPNGHVEEIGVDNMISVKAGTYIVLMNDLTGQYRFFDPLNPNPNPITDEQLSFDITVQPGESYIDFETYDRPTVTLFSDIEIPLATDYLLNEVDVRLKYDGRSSYLYAVRDIDGSYKVDTESLKEIVGNLCGKEREERQLTIEIDAQVSIKGFIEHYVATTPITCLMPTPLWAPFVYFIGSTNGWTSSDQKLASSTIDGIYTGFCYLADPNGWGLEFKFQKRQGDWSNDSQLNSSNVDAVNGDFAKNGDNFKATAGEGVYYVVIDLLKNTITGTKIETMSIIGNFSGWLGDVDMTWDAERYCYTAENVGATAAGWKFRANHEWGINIGGPIDNLVNDGDNTYIDANKIVLYPTRRDNDYIYCTVEP